MQGESLETLVVIGVAWHYDMAQPCWFGYALQIVKGGLVVGAWQACV